MKYVFRAFPAILTGSGSGLENSDQNPFIDPLVGAGMAPGGGV